MATPMVRCGSGAPTSDESHPVTHGLHRPSGDLTGPGGAPGQDAVELFLVAEHLLRALTDRGERVEHELGELFLQRAVAGADVPPLEILDGRSRQRGVD